MGTYALSMGFEIKPLQIKAFKNDDESQWNYATSSGCVNNNRW